MNGSWEHAWGFLSWLFADWREDAPIRFWAERDTERHIRWARNREELREVTRFLLERNAERWHVFVQPNPCREARRAEGGDWGGRKDNVAYVHALMLDWDVVKRQLNMPFIRELIDRAGLRLHALIRSGHGQHGYFKLQPCDVAAFERVAHRTCFAFFSDAVGNANRLMRLPGTINWKTDAPIACYVEALRDGTAYTLPDITAGLDRIGAPPGPDDAFTPDEWQALDYGEDTKGVSDLPASLASLPEHLQYAMTSGLLPEGWYDRSKFDFAACCALVSIGLSDIQIAEVYTRTHLGQIKAAEQGTAYLGRTVKAARNAVAQTVLYLPETLQRLIEAPNDFWYLADDGSVLYNAAASRAAIYQTYLEQARQDNKSDRRQSPSTRYQ